MLLPEPAQTGEQLIGDWDLSRYHFASVNAAAEVFLRVVLVLALVLVCAFIAQNSIP